MLLLYIGGTFFFSWFAFPILVKAFGIYGLRRHCRHKRGIAITFDDGPSLKLTPAVLGILAEYQAKATFFRLGKKLESNIPLFSHTDAAGHEVGSHSYEHLNAWTRSPFSVHKDIDMGFSLAVKCHGSRWFRPPYGKVTLPTLLQTWAKGWRFGWWTLNSGDTWPEPKPIGAVLNEIRREGGGVILLHDHDRPNNPGREDYVMDLTRAILEMARSEGFRMCTMTEIQRA